MACPSRAAGSPDGLEKYLNTASGRPKSGWAVRSRPWKRGHQEISRDIKGSWGQSHRSYEEKSRQLLIFYATNRRTWKNRRVAHKHVLPSHTWQDFPKKFCSHWATSGSILSVFSPGIQKSRRLTQTTFPNPVHSWASCWAAHALLLESESCRVLTCWDALYVKGLHR